MQGIGPGRGTQARGGTRTISQGGSGWSHRYPMTAGTARCRAERPAPTRGGRRAAPGSPEPVGRHDQGGAALSVAGTRVLAPGDSPAQVAWQHEAGLTHPASVQVDRQREAIDLLYPAAHQVHPRAARPHLGGVTVRHMHPDRISMGCARRPALPIGPHLRGQGGLALLAVPAVTPSAASTATSVASATRTHGRSSPHNPSRYRTARASSTSEGASSVMSPIFLARPAWRRHGTSR